MNTRSTGRASFAPRGADEFEIGGIGVDHTAVASVTTMPSKASSSTALISGLPVCAAGQPQDAAGQRKQARTRRRWRAHPGRRECTVRHGRGRACTIGGGAADQKTGDQEDEGDAAAARRTGAAIDCLPPRRGSKPARRSARRRHWPLPSCFAFSAPCHRARKRLGKGIKNCTTDEPLQLARATDRRRRIR